MTIRFYIKFTIFLLFFFIFKIFKIHFLFFPKHSSPSYLSIFIISHGLSLHV
ncbi:unnamed protein product [Meloidogyne enterolobii]|uniref:Uncharacterized protein n=1 Tax=Meloidogyne enterolobii TaxID=390850 RepID=A0ACB0YLG7_MELEN